MHTKSVQVRFVEARLPRDANLSRLRRPVSQIKYIALYENKGNMWVLAQGTDKFTIKKWKEILSAAMVQPVDNMCASIASAKTLEGFEEYGSYSKQRNAKPAQDPPKIDSPSKVEQKEVLLKPGILMARKAYLDAAKRMEERKRHMPPFIPSDYEIDIDEVPITTPRRPMRELLKRGREGARKAALEYMEVLRRANRLHENMIPPCLRS